MEKEQYLTFEEFREEYKQYLLKVRRYSEDEADFAISDFYDPWSYELTEYEYLFDEIIDGKEYMSFTCEINFVKHFGSMLERLGGVDTPEFDAMLTKMDEPFQFMFYIEKSLNPETFGEYCSAEKIYRLGWDD